VLKDGYFLEYMGHPTPCPKGEYKTGTGAVVSCTKCPEGVTTPSEASISSANCSVLVPSHYATQIAPNGGITSASPCVQKFYCPGAGTPAFAFDPANPTQHSPAETLVNPCPWGTFTQQMGASAQYECSKCPSTDSTGNTHTYTCTINKYR
jgi:hypothetical protein